MSDFAELIATVEQVRAARYPALDAALVARVLAFEAEHPDDRNAAMRAIKQAVLAALEPGAGGAAPSLPETESVHA